MKPLRAMILLSLGATMALSATEVSYEANHFEMPNSGEELSPKLSENAGNVWDTYVSVSISGLLHNFSTFQIGRSRQFGNRSLLLTLEPGVARNYYHIAGNVLFKQRFNPFEKYPFFAGIGLNAGFSSSRYDRFAFALPMAAIGVEIPYANNTTQVVEIRTFLSSFATDYGLKGPIHYDSYQPNFQINLGLLF